MKTDQKLAQRLKMLRAEQNWSFDDLVARSGISRASLSRLEKGDVSPTAHVLGKLCAAYGLTMSRLMRMVEDDFIPLVCRHEQSVWQDPEGGFIRQSVSPPAQALAGEVLECSLKPATSISYVDTPRRGLEHHLLMQRGQLAITVDGCRYDLRAGDCLRYQLQTDSHFETPADCGATYLLFIV